jgi:predicted RND superfamily exporter protein
MAIVVIGGLITSTFLSLLVIPVVFTFVDDTVQKLKQAFSHLHRHRHTTATPSGALPGPADHH